MSLGKKRQEKQKKKERRRRTAEAIRIKASKGK